MVYRDPRRYAVQVSAALITFGLSAIGALSAEGEPVSAAAILSGGFIGAALMWRTAMRRTVATTEGLEIHGLFRTERIQWDDVRSFDILSRRSPGDIDTAIVVLNDGSSRTLAGTEVFGAIVRTDPGEFPRAVVASASVFLSEHRLGREDGG